MQNGEQLFDLSVVVNIYREARLIHPTLRSLSDAVSVVIAAGFTVEIVLVLDRTDSATLSYLDDHLHGLFPNAEVHELSVHNGDLGLSRNSGLNFSRGRFIAFSDDDNLYSPNWLLQSIEQLLASDDNVIMHPTIIVNFDHKDVLWRTVNSDDPKFDVRALVESNYWDATCVAPREVFESIPYTASLAGPGFGPEDWHWNCETLEAGWQHRAAVETALFYRVKSTGSLLARLEGGQALLAPTDLLANPRGRTSEQREASLANVDGAQGFYGEVVEVWTSKPADAFRGRLLGASRSVVKHGARLLRWTTRIHPRVELLASRVKPAIVDFLAPPRRTKIALMAPPGDLAPQREVAPQIEEFPAWLLASWREAHFTEPALFPSQATLHSIIRWTPPATDFIDVYWHLIDQLMRDGKPPDYLFLVPWISIGGANAVTESYVRAIRQEDPTARVVILSTLPGSVSLGESTDPLVSRVDIPSAFYRLDSAMQERLIGTLLVQTAPRIIHLINSPVGFRVFALYSKMLTFRSKLYVSIFTLDESPEGQRGHYLLQSIRSYFDSLSGVLVDNQPLVDLLVKTYALPRSRFYVHYQPVAVSVLELAEKSLQSQSDLPALADRTKRLSVLWAARLDRQKRPDILIAISERSRELKLPIDFYASGAALLDDDPTVLERLRGAGVNYLGPYEASIATLNKRFDVLLLTSQWEGLPLTLLDGALNELTIVAPAVGGVPDFVDDEVSGYLIPRFDDVDAYISTLVSLANGTHAVTGTRQAARELALGRHSWDNFVSALRASAGYLR